MSSMSARYLVVGIAGLALGGCRFKGWEGFTAATTPNPPVQRAVDLSSWGGDAMASGGRHTKTTYGRGSSVDVSAPLNAAYDQPAKGVGQNPGEGTIESAPGYKEANGPAFQNSPSSLGGATTQSER